MGWEHHITPLGRIYYVDHNTRTASWDPPPVGFAMEIDAHDAASSYFDAEGSDIDADSSDIDADSSDIDVSDDGSDVDTHCVPTPCRQRVCLPS
jgi:hypothetical protein